MAGTRLERETTIIFNEEERKALIWTCSPTMIRRLDKLAEGYPDAYKCVLVDGDARRYEVDKRYIRFGKPASAAQIARGKYVASLMAAKKAEEVENADV